MSDLDLLRTLGDRIVPPPLEALRETARRRNRRSGAVTAVAAAAVLVAVVGGAVLIGSDDETKLQPVGPVDTSRPPTYALGTDVHYGDDVAELPEVVEELDLTDDGVVVRTADGGIWFTDGSDPSRVGTLGKPGRVYDDEDHAYGTTWGFVVSGNVGSTVAWLEFPDVGKPQLVVYDTGAGKASLRQTVEPPSSGYMLLASVTERFVYWFTSAEPDLLGEDVNLPDARLEVATGTQQAVKPAMYESDSQVSGQPRTMLINHAQGDEPVKYWVVDGTAWQFDVGGGRVKPQGPQPLDARDGATGVRFSFDAERAAPTVAPGWLIQWVNDATVIIGGNHRTKDYLFECHLSTGACTLSLELPARAVLPEIG